MREKYVLIYNGKEIDRTTHLDTAKWLRREYQLAFKGIVKIEEIEKENPNWIEKF